MCKCNVAVSYFKSPIIGNSLGQVAVARCNVCNGALMNGEQHSEAARVMMDSCVACYERRCCHHWAYRMHRQW